ncbi:P-loop containing nucleoside triphosphate hydrolase protein [Fomitiporia mediterranea MF3/22]|uniref:P-loop containing nucleoside triphosphate hydrolase protein n=1 Tax=Fomitiporia mediterranea (strain MF3/22) TaxID=694068 RepID=UPI00044091B9|nr:P-loop containing nucleoside triphosphate hydrolase protein [Fomitiporia mediterranea MF3/22]EJD02191.1 P-loop containing nucleoside triphosphate hydrolase protein [Fomitiporia mediterranea MF3/22]
MSARSSQSQTRSRGNDPRNAHGLRLRPVSELPDMYRCIFKFGVFNAVQSKCYQTVRSKLAFVLDVLTGREDNGKSRKSSELVLALLEVNYIKRLIAAPTGGGKTVLFELGLINLLITSGHQANTKCIYVAPTKALCSERTRDWTAKFEPLGIKCCEMTGDTLQMGKSAWSMARNAKIIEKWDSLTRGWHDHGDFLSAVKLFLVDEVHVLNESRGSTLEVVISRMKARCHNIRFILVSATVPNIQDVANWIGNPSIDLNAPATVFEFGEEYRPCRITRHVYGYPRKNQNDFQFARTLDYKLYSVIGKHACGKPILIFCSTRKGVMSTAEQLLKEYDEAVAKREDTPWNPPKHITLLILLHEAEMFDIELAKSGVGVHHAGLSLDDRRATEELYLDGSLRVVCATSTLAVGINLPAHTVVIKGVKLYVTNGWREYSDLDVVQMIGRAGRPQFDKEGVAIILCEQELENKYRNLAQGRTILESSLHENLLEHVNSEIGIGAINNVQSAKDWLRGSFLRQRVQKNPGHYHIGKTASQTWEEKLDDMVVQAVKKLETNELISTGGGGINAELRVTEYGDIMSKYYIRQVTMQNILKLSDRPSVREIVSLLVCHGDTLLELISCADESVQKRASLFQCFYGTDTLTIDLVYNKMRDHSDIRYKIKKVEKASDKSFILIQAVLGGISLSAPEYKTSDSQPVLDALSVFRHAARIGRVVVEVGIIKKNGAQVKHGLELVRCLTAKAWEDRPVVLKQIESIGEKSCTHVNKVLAESGITSLQALRKQESSRIELLLNRRPPYGLEVLQFVHDMPQYAVSIAVAKNGVTSYSGRKPVSVELNIECHLVQALSGRTKSRQKSRFLGMTTILTTTSDLDLVDFRRISTKALKDSRSFTVTAQLTKPSQSVCVLVSSESFAGLSVSQTYKPSVPVKEYPILDTHPKTSTEMFLEECEQDPDFWDKMNSDGESARGTDASRPSSMLKFILTTVGISKTDITYSSAKQKTS